VRRTKYKRFGVHLDTVVAFAVGTVSRAGRDAVFLRFDEPRPDSESDQRTRFMHVQLVHDPVPMVGGRFKGDSEERRRLLRRAAVGDAY
jgi:hypothetical protein